MMRFTKVLLVALLLAGSCAYAIPVTFVALLNGPSENPSNGSAGTGFAFVTFDKAAHTLDPNVSFSGLTGTTTASLIHCCIAAPGNAEVATQTPSFIGFPLGVSSGVFINSYDTTLLATYNAPFF